MSFLKACFQPETHQGFSAQKEEYPRVDMLPPKPGESRVSQPQQSRAHFNFSNHPRSLPNKLKSRSRMGNQQTNQAQALENDCYKDFLRKKQGDQEMWGQTFGEYQK